MIKLRLPQDPSLRRLIRVLGAVVVLGVLTGGIFASAPRSGTAVLRDKTASLAAGPSAGGVGYVDIAAAMQRHSLYPKLKRVQTQLQTETSRWDNYVAQVLADMDPAAYQEWAGSLQSDQTEALQDQVAADIERYTGSVQTELEKTEKSIAAEAEKQWESTKQAQAAKVREKQEALAKQLETELNEKADSLKTRYQKKILNLQVELVLARLSSAEREEKAEQLRTLQAEMEQEVSELNNHYNALLDEKTKQVAADYEKELKSIEAKINRDVQQQLDAARRQAESNLNRYVKVKEDALTAAMTGREQTLSRIDGALAQSLVDEGVVSSQTVQMQKSIEHDLKRQVESLEETIMADVKEAAARVAGQRRLQAVLADGEMALDQVDVTDAVIQKMNQIQ